MLRGKEQKLQKLAGYRYFRASTPAEVDRLLGAFFVQKAASFEAHGVRNVFAEVGIADFSRAACIDGLEQGRQVIKLHAIEGDGTVLAVLVSIANDQRFSAMLNSYTHGERARWRPGLVLLTHIARDCADRGLASFDLGAGYASYKWFFCKEIEPLIDNFLPFSASGRLAAATVRLGYGLKGRIKRTPALWSRVQMLRRMLA